MGNKNATSASLNPIPVAREKNAVPDEGRLLRKTAVDPKAKTTIELYDTTLRDGEQAVGASFGRAGRLAVYRALDDLGIHYVELGWPIASQDIKDSFTDCRAVQKRAKIAAFGSTSIRQRPDHDENLKSIIDVRPDVACIFGKSWTQHVAAQLRISEQANIDRISGSVDLLRRKRIGMVFYDAEHYFDGFKDNPEYALSTLRAAARAGADRLILCDTNGGTLTSDVIETVSRTKEWLRSERIDVPLGTHFHDDSGVAVANAYATLRWVQQVQGTINGMGERVGNLNLGTFMAGFVEKMGGVIPGLDLRKLKGVVEAVYHHTGLPMPKNLPYVGSNAFTHRGGVHQDGVHKSAKYEHIDPGKVGNSRVLSLNSLGGRRGTLLAAERFGHRLDKNDPIVVNASKVMLEQVREMEMKGYRIGEIEAEQYLIIEKHFGRLREFFTVQEPTFSTKKTADGRELSMFSTVFKVNGSLIRDEIEVEGGPVDAAYKSYKRVLSGFYESINNLHLENFTVGIAKELEESSTVRTEITFHNSEEQFSTVGVDPNLLMSALEAMNKGFNYYLNIVEGK
jgi:2-isopropylmalate synthase